MTSVILWALPGSVLGPWPLGGHNPGSPPFLKSLALLAVSAAGTPPWPKLTGPQATRRILGERTVSGHSLPSSSTKLVENKVRLETTSFLLDTESPQTAFRQLGLEPGVFWPLSLILAQGHFDPFHRWENRGLGGEMHPGPAFLHVRPGRTHSSAQGKSDPAPRSP